MTKNNTNIEIIDENVNSIQLDEQVLEQFIADNILQFKEVSRLAAMGITENVTKNVLHIDSSTHGIRISKDDDSNIINITIHLFVYYGVNIPQLSYDIQSKIKSSVERITNYEVKTVNITVAGIDRVREIL